MNFKTNKIWRKSISTNETAPEELREKYKMKYEKNLYNFSLKRKCGADIENCLSEEPGEVLQKLFKRWAYDVCNFVMIISNK